MIRKTQSPSTSIHLAGTLWSQPEFALVSADDSAAALSDEQCQSLQYFVRSTQVEIDPQTRQMKLAGVSLEHYLADPALQEPCHHMPGMIDFSDPASFHQYTEHFALCLEDHWSGYFVAQQLRRQLSDDPVVLIHLDDHTDMMSTLLRVQRPDEPLSGGACVFDPQSPENWDSAIGSGALSIGSFVTALYYCSRPLHVLHLRDREGDQHQAAVVDHSSVTHPLIPDVRFADITLKKTGYRSDAHGFYVREADPVALLQHAAVDQVIVHIDLDYFINDYNGNLGAIPELTLAEARNLASRRADAFFYALYHSGCQVLCWIVAVSPGFCRVEHWCWLLDMLSERISAFTRQG